MKSVKEKTDMNYRQPGKLIFTRTLIIHTRQACKIVQGLKKPKGTIGLMSFARNVRQIHEKAKKDNPYAELLLMKIFDDMKTIEIDLKRQASEIKQKLEGYKHMNVDIAESISPQLIELKFSSAYAYLGSHLIGFFDEWARYWYMTKLLGIKLTLPHQRLMRLNLKKVLQVFNKAFQWKPIDITRQDILENSEIYREAQALFGSLPEAVITKSIRAPFLVVNETNNILTSNEDQFVNDLEVMK